MNAGETYTIFDEATRLPTARITCAPEQLAAQVKAGQIAISGRFDCSTTRLSNDGKPVHDHERASDRQHDRLRAARIARIAELESKQHRRVRELLSETDPMLRELEQEINTLRGDL